MSDQHYSMEATNRIINELDKKIKDRQFSLLKQRVDELEARFTFLLIGLGLILVLYWVLEVVL